MIHIQKFQPTWSLRDSNTVMQNYYFGREIAPIKKYENSILRNMEPK